MSGRRFVWVVVGLVVWAAVVVLWATGPRNCQAPDEHGRVVCGQAGASR